MGKRKKIKKQEILPEPFLEALVDVNEALRRTHSTERSADSLISDLQESEGALRRLIENLAEHLQDSRPKLAKFLLLAIDPGYDIPTKGQDHD